MTTHRKTAKGQHEIETRTHRLAPRVRSMLILVDGRRSEAELRQLVPQQADETLALLIGQGFIEPVPTARGPTAATTATPTVSPAAATAPSPPGALTATPAAAATPTSPAPFEQTRREAVRALNDLVGPMGEALAIRMERARDARELAPLLVTAVQVIGNTRGRQAAQAFAARFSAAGPAAG